jgi:hypothetical protein
VRCTGTTRAQASRRGVAPPSPPPVRGLQTVVARAPASPPSALPVRGGSESACTPDSVRADEPPWVTIPLGRRLLDGSCGLPGFSGRAALTLLDLAPGGVCRATRVTPGAGALLPHRFTLTCARRTGPSAVCSLLHCPAGRPDWVLPSTVPCGVRTFLGSSPCEHGPIRGHPANSLPGASLGP